MISIVIPTFNSKEFLEKCLSAVKSQKFSLEQIELVIVDNGSVDNTVDIARKYTDNIFVDPNANVSGLRNVGAEHSKGKILFFLDSDCIPQGDWIENALEVLDKQKVSATGCWYSISDRPTWVEKAWDFHMSQRRDKEGAASWVPSGNFIIKREIFDRVGGFNGELQTGEDTDICNRLIKSGEQIFVSPDLSVLHLGEAKTIRQFFDKQRWHGVGAVQRFVREFPGYFLDKSFIFSVLLIISFLGLIISGLKMNILGLYGFSAIALFVPTIMAVQTAYRTRTWKYFLVLVFLYLVYGMARAMVFLNVRLWVREINRGKK